MNNKFRTLASVFSAGVPVLLAALVAIAPMKPPYAPQWFCTASDFQGGFGSGFGATRDAAEGEAIINCQEHSHGSCSIQSCSAH